MCKRESIMNASISDRSKWIILITSLCVIIYSVIIFNESLGRPAEGCYFKKTYGIACAACGGSHSIQALFHGQILTAIQYNLLAMLMVLASFAMSALILADLLLKSDYFSAIASWFQYRLRLKKWGYLAAFLLILFWIFNAWTYR